MAPELVNETEEQEGQGKTEVGERIVEESGDEEGDLEPGHIGVEGMSSIDLGVPEIDLVEGT